MSTHLPPEPDADASSTRIGERLRRAREARGLTLRDVADASGDAFQLATLSAWERGERRIGLPSLMWLADHYGMAVGSLLGSRRRGEGRPVLVVDPVRLADAAPFWEPLQALVERTIAAREEPTGGEVRLRAEDVDFVATVLGLTVDQLVERLLATDIASTRPTTD